MKNTRRFIYPIALILIFSMLAALFSSCEGVGDNCAEDVSFDIHSHTWDAWVSVKDAACTEDGTVKRECSDCGKTQTMTPAPLGHVLGDWTESENGEKVKTCTVCGEVVASETVYTTFSEGVTLGINRDHTGYMIMGIGTCKDDVIVIPHEYQGFPVTEVNDSAFENCGTVKCLILPDTVKYIGNRAFYGSSLESIYIPDCVTYIGEYAFSECENLTNVILPNSLTEISPYLFSGCKNLAKIYLPTEISLIPEYAFAETAITSLTLPHAVTDIGKHAFGSCSSLKRITLPEGLTNIGSSAFESCKSLEEIILPETLIKLEPWLFSQCTDLKKVSLPSSLTSLPKLLFNNCQSLQEVTIPDGVISLGYSCFAGCRSLTEINLPDSLIKINFGAFSGCSSLVTVKLPEKVRAIETMTFANCPSLTDLYIPASVMNISVTAFIGTGESLTNVVISPDNKYYYSDGSGIYEYYSKSVVHGTADGSIPRDPSLTAIGACAFQERNDLTEIIIPKNITKIGTDAFKRCENVTSISFEGTVAEWKKVSLDLDWFTGAELTVVHCSDGDAELIVERSRPQWD